MRRGRNLTMTMAISPINGLVFSSAALSRINAARFDNFLAQAKTNLDSDEEVIFVYDGAPAHRNPVIPAPNTELKMLPPHSPFPNIVEQAISCLKAAIKANISRSETQNAWITEMRPEPEESHWGSFEHNCLRLCTETSTL